MPRGKDAPAQVGGKIDPYVQGSIQQDKQLAENRLVAAMRETGATTRAGIAAAAQGGGGGEGLAIARERSATQLELADKQAAEDERGKREDRKYAQTMTEATREFQAKQAELDREQQKAIIVGDRKYKGEIEKRREALRRFNIELSMDAGERTTNAMLSILKGSLKRQTSMEKAKTVLEEEATRFDKDKDVYLKTKDKVAEAVEFDKRMDLPARKPRAAFRGAGAGMTFGLPEESKEKLADPMAILQDQITKYGGNISVEELAPGTISKIEDEIQRGDIKTEDINKTLGALEGMLAAVDTRRRGVAKDSDEFDFWQDTHLNISQMRDDLEGLTNSKKKIAGSETETVGARVQYALGSIHDSSLGGRAARMRDLVGGDFTAVFEEMTKPTQVPKLYDISADMNEYDVEYRTWFNDYLRSRYPELQGVE